MHLARTRSLFVLVSLSLLAWSGCKEESSRTVVSNQTHANGDRKTSNGITIPEIKPSTKKSTLHRFGTYSFELPERFVRTEIDAEKAKALPAGYSVATWAVQDAAGEPLESLVLMTIDDPKYAAEAKRDPRRALVNSSQGTVDRMGFQAAQRGRYISQSWGDLRSYAMSVMMKNADNREVMGQFYILPEVSPLLSVTYINFEMKNVEQVEEVEAHLQTMAKD
ncbi:MAG: hypothetical protein ACK5OB_19875 [Pirellula sp.]|jgi:hypothetical protein